MAPIRLRPPPLAWFGSGTGKQPLLQNRIRDVVRKRPTQPCRFEPNGSSAAPSRGRPRPAAQSPGPKPPSPSVSSPRAHGTSQASPLIRSFQKPKGADLSEPEETASPRAISYRNGGRFRAESWSGHLPCPTRPIIRTARMNLSAFIWYMSRGSAILAGWPIWYHPALTLKAQRAARA